METPMRRAVMTPAHPKWAEFVTRLAGPEGCHFRQVQGQFVSDCDGEPSRPKATALLKDYDVDVEASLAYFDEHGGHCDCEVVFNVEQV